jgi:outer membrane protein assembly factor BamD
MLLALSLFILVSCGGQKAVQKIDNPGNLYVEGVDWMKKKKYDKAIADFAKVRENYPFDPIAMVAQVKEADAHFAKKEYQLAAGIYEDFVNSYPEDENAAYALRRVAECYEKLSPTPERDQANTFKAMERLTFLKNRYPNSPYSRDADSHLKTLTEKLAARELYVGEFYHKYGSYNASILRLNYFLDKYPEAKGKDRALHYLAEDYKELQDFDKAQYYVDRLKQECPKSIYARSIKRERKTLQLGAAGPVNTAVVSDQSRAAVAPAAAPAAMTAGVGQEAPEASPYEEKRTRQIDLRPTEGTPPGESAPAGGQAPKDPEKSAPGQQGRADPPDPPPGAALTGAAGEGRIGEGSPAAGASETPGPAGDETRSGAAQEVKGDHEAANAEAGEKAGEKKQAKKPGDKKDSLGFFTEKKPVDVIADTMEGLEKGKIIVFKGNVIAKQVDLYLFSDMLTAYVNEVTNEIERAKAEGNVKIVKLERTATCKEAFFYNDKGEIILKGDVVVYSGKDKVSGDTVTYYINEDRVYVQGEKEKRAKALISPK